MEVWLLLSSAISLLLILAVVDILYINRSFRRSSKLVVLQGTIKDSYCILLLLLSKHPELLSPNNSPTFPIPRLALRLVSCTWYKDHNSISLERASKTAVPNLFVIGFVENNFFMNLVGEEEQAT